MVAVLQLSPGQHGESFEQAILATGTSGGCGEAPEFDTIIARLHQWEREFNQE